jgi:hypothetical protein
MRKCDDHHHYDFQITLPMNHLHKEMKMNKFDPIEVIELTCQKYVQTVKNG